jgi:hypothetical protein
MYDKFEKFAIWFIIFIAGVGCGYAWAMKHFY